jgi:hypothetical protein
MLKDSPQRLTAPRDETVTEEDIRRPTTDDRRQTTDDRRQTTDDERIQDLRLKTLMSRIQDPGL